MKVTRTDIPDVCLIEPRVFGDARGFFYESFNQRAFAEARPIITSMPGCRSLSLSRSIESPSSYLLLVAWEQLEDHTIGFRKSTRYEECRDLLQHFDEPFPLFEHYQAAP